MRVYKTPEIRNVAVVGTACERQDLLVDPSRSWPARASVNGSVERRHRPHRLHAR